MKNYDIAIVGGGPGGYNAALHAANYKVKVALIEKDRFGGACLFRGCIPTKALYAGVHQKIAYDTAFLHKNEVVETLGKQVEGLVKNGGIDIYKGTATFVSAHEIAVSGGEFGNESITADKIVIATGSSPIIPASLDVDKAHARVMSSDELVHLQKIPASILIIGGGYIGCEFGSIFARYGAAVTIVEATGTILQSEDADVVRLVHKSFEEKKVRVLVNTQVTKLEVTESSVKSYLSNNETIETEYALLAIGRAPNINAIALEKTGVAVTPKGITVSEKLQTNIPHIYAIGDVISAPLRLAHVAEREGAVVIENALGKSTPVMDYHAIPTAIFTNPEISSIGYREFELKQKNAAYATEKSFFKANPMAHCEGQTDGFLKMLIDTQTQTLLGATVVGEHATELLGALVVAMNSKTPLSVLAHTPWFHPSRTEAIGKAAISAMRKVAGTK